MSTTFHLVCPDTDKYIWVGQNGRIYKGAEYMEKLEAFLYAHEGKSLVFVSEHNEEHEDCLYHDEWEIE